MLNGPVIMTADERSETLYSGDCVSIPPGCIHTMKNIAEEDVRYIVVGISSGRGGRTVLAGNDKKGPPPVYND